MRAARTHEKERMEVVDQDSGVAAFIEPGAIGVQATGDPVSIRSGEPA